jgi:5-dehydro-2-deoxygluconokinase
MNVAKRDGATRKPGYPKELLILPFDHRGSFQSKLFGIEGHPTPEQTKLVASYKMMIYEGFEKAVAAGGLPKDEMGILVDEQFGDDVIRRAKQSGFTVSIPAEKSGQDEFDFEYGSHYLEHIQRREPTFCKVLVRYNPEGDKAVNQRQASRLAELSRALRTTSSYFMFELLVPATEAQLQKCKGDKHVYDLEMRPRLMVQAIVDLQKAGVEADVWKVEGLDRTSDFERVCTAAQADGRSQVGCIVLGRGENDSKVREWLTVGAKVRGVIGFAVGRTVFWDPLKGFKDGKLTREQAVTQIADKYKGFCDLWKRERGAH